MHQVSMVDTVGISVTVATGNGVARSAVVPDSVRGNAYRWFSQLRPMIRGYVVNEGPACQKVRVKVADSESVHRTMDDRVVDLRPREKGAAIIDRLPSAAHSARRSFVEQTVIPNRRRRCWCRCRVFTFRIAAYDTHVTRRKRVWPIEHRAGNGDAGSTRIIQDRPTAATIQGTRIKKTMRSHEARR